MTVGNIAHGDNALLRPQPGPNTITRIYNNTTVFITEDKAFNPGDSWAIMDNIVYERNYLTFVIPDSLNILQVDSAFVTFTHEFTMGDGLSHHWPKFYGQSNRGTLSLCQYGDNLGLDDWNPSRFHDFTLIQDLTTGPKSVNVTPAIGRWTGQDSLQFMFSCYPDSFDLDYLYDKFSISGVGMYIYYVPTGVEEEEEVENLPSSCQLLPNYPNPFNPNTTIRYQISTPGLVRLNIYNIHGQLVRSLINGYCAAGFHETRWDGSNSSGQHLASGIYICSLHANDLVQTNKMILQK